MKTKKLSLFLSTLLFCIVIQTGCTTSQTRIYNDLMEYAGTIKVVDTHEHQRNPNNLNYQLYNCWTLLNHSYLMADVISAGGTSLSTEKLNNATQEELWEMNGKYLNYCMNTSYYSQFLQGLKICYGYQAPVLTKAGMIQLSEQTEKEYRDYDSWFDNCFQKANFQTMFLDQYWAPLNMTIDRSHFTLIFNINKLVYDIGNAKKIYSTENEKFNAFTEKTGLKSIQSLEDYLGFAGFLLQSNVEHGAVGLKNSMAYGRTLDYENVPKDRAVALFRKTPNLTASEEKALQDFMFHWFLDQAAEYHLPVQIHTGYLAGNGNQLDNGMPIKLNNLFSQHPKTKFDLFHGGFPWTGEFVALGKMFPNVYLNLVWLPQISKERAKVTLSEMLDCVPYNKFLWGGDCHFIEETMGSLEVAKQVVCEVLAERVSTRKMDEATAKKIISAVFRENAIELFQLN
jgi:uncharacterized protein